MNFNGRGIFIRGSKAVTITQPTANQPFAVTDVLPENAQDSLSAQGELLSLVVTKDADNPVKLAENPVKPQTSENKNKKTEGKEAGKEASFTPAH